jgi:hypothetical protein
MAKRKPKVEELLARVESEGYKRGHAERKTTPETKRDVHRQDQGDQNAVLDRYIL